jgi:hypothetical protein
MISITDLVRFGACQGFQDPRFLEDDPDLVRPDVDIQVMCLRCPVRADCLEYALEHEDNNGEAGIWGGTTPFQRRQLKVKKLSRVRCPGCDSDAVEPTGRGEVCLSCGISWLV